MFSDGPGREFRWGRPLDSLVVASIKIKKNINSTSCPTSCPYPEGSFSPRIPKDCNKETGEAAASNSKLTAQHQSILSCRITQTATKTNNIHTYIASVAIHLIYRHQLSRAEVEPKSTLLFVLVYTKRSDFRRRQIRTIYPIAVLPRPSDG